MRSLIAGVAAIVLATTTAQAQPGRTEDGKRFAPQRGDILRDASRAADTFAPLGGRPDRGVAALGRGASSDRDGAGALAARLASGRGQPSLIDSAIETTGRLFANPRARGMVAGCPPDLAARRACSLPREVRRGHGNPLAAAILPRLFGFVDYRQDEFVHRAGYLLRLNDAGGIAGYLPLLGGALAAGNSWPEYYPSGTIAPYYVDYFGLGGPDHYRFADNVIYRYDPGRNAISSVAALLTGDRVTVGEPMPAGYDIYNVPHAYRGRYRDTPDAHYRYADGHIYRIDPQTQRVTAVIDLLV